MVMFSPMRRPSMRLISSTRPFKIEVLRRQNLPPAERQELPRQDRGAFGRAIDFFDVRARSGESPSAPSSSSA